MFGLITTIATSLLGMGKTFIDRKAELAKARHDSKVQWEGEAAKAMDGSWKDEWWTVVISVPLITVWVGVMFNIPILIDRSRDAFDVMRGMPDWYFSLLLVAFLASFGIKPAVKGIAGLIKGKIK
jgi:hypothetical protein